MRDRNATIITHPSQLGELRRRQRLGVGAVMPPPNPKPFSTFSPEYKRMMHAKGLGELPADLMAERKQGPAFNPGAGLVPQWENRYTATNFPFTIGLTSIAIIPSNPLRCYVLIQNKNAGSDMFVNFGNSANDYNGILIIPRGNFEVGVGGSNNGPFSPSDSIHVVGSVAGMNGVIVEGILPPMTPTNI